MSYPSYTTPAIVLKRSNVGETDRVVTLLTRDKGKIVVIAKGCRKMSSSKRAFLEPGNHIDAYLIETKSMPILTQARLVNEFPNTKQSLLSMKKLFQILEIVDKLIVEEEDTDHFETIYELLTHFDHNPHNHHSIHTRLETFIASLGFQDPQDTIYSSLSEYVSSLAERPMRSYEFLTVK